MLYQYIHFLLSLKICFYIKVQKLKSQIKVQKVVSLSKLHIYLQQNQY